jgi:3-oxoacyl-[acyl-carrier protein] reductase
MAAPRAVLVTGSSRGIGAAIAQAFAGQGDRVAVHHRDSAELAGQVRDGLPGQGHVVVQADLADPDATGVMVDQAHRQLGGLDVLVNNAGIYLDHAITEASYEQWRDAWEQTLRVNLLGPANATWCAVQYMKDTGGAIINVSSRGAIRGELRHPAYAASKGGLNSMSGSLARTLAPYGISVATVSPGYVDTEMAAEHLDSEIGDEIRAQSPFNRVATPEEVAAAVIYLASAEGGWASGANIDLNGASYLRP